MNKKIKALGLFTVLNLLVVLAISSRFYQQMPVAPEGALEWSFLLLGSFSHLALLCLVLAALTLPLIVLPSAIWRLLVSGITSLLLVALFVDTAVFAQYKFHINGAVVDLILAGQIVDFPLSTWIIVIGSVITLWAAQWWLLGLLLNLNQPPKVFKKLVSLTFVAFLSASVIHIWAAAHAYQPVTSLKRYLPMYHPISANSFMRKRGWINEEEVAKQKALSQKRVGAIQYPLKELAVEPVEQPVNIVLVVIDSWRYDTMNADNTPNIWKIAQQGASFDNHQAAGNSTRTGIFGLFYGLPGTYWQGILSGQTSPVLMQRLHELDYQIGVFASAQLRKPEFNRTVFSSIENLREESMGNTPSERDLDLLKDWKQWQQAKDTEQPAFSFLFFDAPHGYDFPKDFEAKYLPQVDEIDYINLSNKTDPEPIFNRYKNSVLFTDTLVGEVVKALEHSGELENTLLIITGDHGQEMNDTQQNYWGHNSNFTRHQVQVPFIIAGPNAEQLVSSSQLTSHADLAPTLLKGYLGVTNDVADFSSGVNLFNPPQQRDWVLSASYSMFAILTHDRIFEVDATGQSQLLDADNNHLRNEKLNPQYLQEAIQEISRFNR